GITTPTALAAPVDEGMMFSRMPRPPRQSLLLGPSTVFWVAVAACTVVITPRLMPHLSCSTLATGDWQLVVHEGLEMIASPVCVSWSTLHTNLRVSSFVGSDWTVLLRHAYSSYRQYSMS